MSIANIKRYAMRNIKLKPMELETHAGFSSSGDLFEEKRITDSQNPGFEPPVEVFRVHRVFFDQPYYKQRRAIRLLLWWSIKHYFKTLFK